MRALLTPITLLAIATCATAQDAAPTPAPPPAPAAAQGFPPPLQLGQRVIRAQQSVRVIPQVVLVKDPRSYLGAIAAWTPTVHFPILIDDGSPAAAEDIARFVRAFKPTKVVSWQEAAPKDAPADDPLFHSIDRPRITGALNQAWDADAGLSMPDFIAVLKRAGSTPPGVVVMNSNDPAWAGGLALAAGRGQPIVWVEARQAIDHFFTVEEADEYCGKVETEIAALPLSWNALGDDIDAVTLATNTPAKLDKGGHDFLAMTDRVGRAGHGTEVPERWAWAGQVHGAAREATYRAMCALFLTHSSAFLFDGYPDAAPWNAYDCTKAADMLKQELEFRTEVLDTPKQSADAWRLRASRPVDADLIFVTTKGNADFFDLNPGQCKPGDVPILSHPSAVHIVHSWSSLFPGLRDLLAGRWMERGTYFYVGSVHEPYLNAFLPTPMLAARMCSGAPWGAAVRQDSGPCWKVAVFGDPLIVYTRAYIATDRQLPLEGAQELGGSLRDDLKNDRFDAAFRALVLTGRDDTLAALVPAILKEKRDKISPAAAELTVLPLFREKKLEDLAAMYAFLDKPRAESPILRDALWLAAYPRMAAPTDAWLSLLRMNLRKDQLTRDATAVAAAIVRTKNAEAGDEFLRQTRAQLTDKAQQEAIDAALKLPKSEWGK